MLISALARARGACAEEREKNSAREMIILGPNSSLSIPSPLSLSVALPLSLLSLFAQPMAAAACAAPVGLAPRRPLLAIAFRGWTQGRRAGPREQ